jgi:Ca2+-binding EF-hand superfamily protein
MGANVEKEVKLILDDPENEKALRKAFKICDKDKNGSLDRDEFHSFAKVVFGVDCTELKKEIVKELKGEMTGVVAAMIGSVAGKGVDIALEKCTSKEAIERFVEQLFVEGDKDNNGTLDYDEFTALMRNHAETKPKDRIEGFIFHET